MCRNGGARIVQTNVNINPSLEAHGELYRTWGQNAIESIENLWHLGNIARNIHIHIIYVCMYVFKISPNTLQQCRCANNLTIQLSS